MRRVWMEKLLALTITGVLFMSNRVGVAATPQTACKEAADIDKRVDRLSLLRVAATRYASAKEKVAETVALVHQCDEAFVQASVRSPLTKQSADSVQLAIICTAITNLIK
ncbi:putative invertase inhibitor [Hordeum vulgare]|nr:putative invertase inhibitor [Hordeum vulgare]